MSTFQPRMTVTLRRLLSRLTALALTTSVPAAAAPRTPVVPVTEELERDDEDELIGDPAIDLAVDLELIDPSDAALALGRSLALAIENMRPLAATQLASTWALAVDPVRRLALANALEWAFPLVGDDIVLEHLSRDPDPEIRAAVARAAWSRRARVAPRGDDGILDRLAADADPTVAAIAKSSRVSG